MEAVPISMESYKIGFVGAGKLAESIAKGVAKSGLLPPDRICTAHSNPNRRVAFESIAVKLVTDNKAVVVDSDVVIFFVKPHLKMSPCS